MRQAALSEILSAIAIIGVSAVIATLLYVTFAEQDDGRENTAITIAEIENARATELLTTTHVRCDVSLDFFLHNYARDVTIHKQNLRMFSSDINGTLTLIPQHDITWMNFDGISIDEIPGSTSADVNISPFDCRYNLILLTPAGEVVLVRT